MTGEAHPATTGQPVEPVDLDRLRRQIMSYEEAGRAAAELRAAREVVKVGRSHVHAEEMDSSMGATTWSALRDAIAAYDQATAGNVR